MERVKELLVILCFSLLGELAHHFIPLPVPASIYGLLFLLAALKTRLIDADRIAGSADFLIEIMPLLFVPAGVGLLASWDALRPVLVPVVVVTFVSTVAVFAVTGIVAEKMLGRKEGKEHE